MKKICRALGYGLIFLTSVAFAEINPIDGWRFLPEKSASIRSNSQQFDLWIGVAHLSISPAPKMPIHVAFETSVPDKMCMQKSKEKYEDTDWIIVNGVIITVSVICMGAHRIMTIVDYSNALKLISAVLSSRNIAMWTSDFKINEFKNRCSTSDMTSENDAFDGRDLMKWMQFGDIGMDPEFLASYSSSMQTIHRIFNSPW